MAWTDFKNPTISVPFGEGQAGDVRGLDIEDFGALLANHLDAMMDITTSYIAMQKDILAQGNMTELLILVSKQFPAFVSEVISIVTDTPALKGKRMSAGLQMQILTAAFKLTVQDAGGLGNLSAIVQSAVRQAVAGRGGLSQKLTDILSPSSIGESEKTLTH